MTITVVLICVVFLLVWSGTGAIATLCIWVTVGMVKSWIREGKIEVSMAVLYTAILGLVMCVVTIYGVYSTVGKAVVKMLGN